eukprot:scaffold13801_cov162-Isochrysis_galbana.AAC.3
MAMAMADGSVRAPCASRVSLVCRMSWSWLSCVWARGPKAKATSHATQVPVRRDSFVRRGVFARARTMDEHAVQRSEAMNGLMRAGEGSRCEGARDTEHRRKQVQSGNEKDRRPRRGRWAVAAERAASMLCMHTDGHEPPLPQSSCSIACWVERKLCGASRFSPAVGAPQHMNQRANRIAAPISAGSSRDSSSVESIVKAGGAASGVLSALERV